MGGVCGEWWLGDACVCLVYVWTGVCGWMGDACVGGSVNGCGWMGEECVGGRNGWTVCEGGWMGDLWVWMGGWVRCGCGWLVGRVGGWGT